MEKLLKSISKSKNFYGPDIETDDFLNSIPYNEIKCISEYVTKYTKDFFKNDKGEVLGYYVCKGQEIFKFYLISVDGKLYMALDAVPPCLWYHVKTYDDFRKIRSAYNGKGDKFVNRLTKISTQLSSNAVLGDIMKTVRNDYENVMLVYNMCMNNPFVGGHIFGTCELYDEYLNKNEYNSMERALLNKYIIDKEHGFCVRTLYSNSIISVKCVNSIFFFSFYYNECPQISDQDNKMDIPLDVYLFMLNFLLIDITDILLKKSSDATGLLNSSLPMEYYGEMRYSVYELLSENKVTREEDPHYYDMLTDIFTYYTVHKITNEYSEEMSKLEQNNKVIKQFIKSKMTDEENKYISNSLFDMMSFVSKDNSDSSNKKESTDDLQNEIDRVLDTISEEITSSSVEMDSKSLKDKNVKTVKNLKK